MIDRELFKMVLSKIETSDDKGLIVFRDRLHEELGKLKDSGYRADFKKCIRLIDEEIISRSDVFLATRK